MSICLIYFYSFLFLSIWLFLYSLMLLSLDYTYLVELNLLMINSSSIMMVILIDWMSILFMSLKLEDLHRESLSNRPRSESRRFPRSEPQSDS